MEGKLAQHVTADIREGLSDISDHRAITCLVLRSMDQIQPVDALGHCRAHVYTGYPSRKC